MQKLLPIKRGDTFSLIAEIKDTNGEPAVIDVANLKSQVKDSVGRLYSELVITTTENVGFYLLKAPSTSAWPITNLYMDIQRTEDGIVRSSETILIPVEKEITT